MGRRLLLLLRGDLEFAKESRNFNMMEENIHIKQAKFAADAQPTNPTRGTIRRRSIMLTGGGREKGKEWQNDIKSV